MGGWRIVALAAVAAAVTACSPTSAEETEATGEATTTTTRTPRITDDSGRPPVTFDPCYDIPDDIMTAAGYDAGKKEVADMPMGSYTFLGCAYDKRDYVPGVRRGYGLNILSGNVTLDEELAKNGHVASPITVRDRAGLREVGPSGNNECTYVLQTEFGIVLFNRLYYTDSVEPAPQDEWCSGMDELVASIEQYLPR
ncbi:DUF3558 domain-containing protein [Rhodococcus sp. NPDC047139]|uniref:DUF3558 domain-containing protein n=1 Tax=Rhodococcus sp. NPDC047139 TaxID=3155141 RepID=UPI0033DDE556